MESLKHKDSQKFSNFWINFTFKFGEFDGFDFAKDDLLTKDEIGSNSDQILNPKLTIVNLFFLIFLAPGRIGLFLISGRIGLKFCSPFICLVLTTFFIDLRLILIFVFEFVGCANIFEKRFDFFMKMNEFCFSWFSFIFLDDFYFVFLDSHFIFLDFRFVFLNVSMRQQKFDQLHKCVQSHNGVA